METQVVPKNTAASGARPVGVKIIGVGRAGIAMLNSIRPEDFPGAGSVAVSAETSSLVNSAAREKIHLESKMLRGLGTGGDPERGRDLAEAHVAQFKTVCTGSDVVFLVAGLGGGSGTGMAPVAARVAKESGALVLAFVTLPFDCEGNRRQRQAFVGLEQLKAAADGVICLPCQKASPLIDENTSLLETFKTTTRLLLDGARGVWRLLALRGLIPLHFADLCSLLRDRHAESCFAAVTATGASRSRDAVEKLFAHPMLENGAALGETEAAVVSIVGGPELTLADVNLVMGQIKEKSPRAQVMMGAVVDERFRDQLALTVIATRPVTRAGVSAPTNAVATAVEREIPGIEAELLRGNGSRKPMPGLLPSLTPDQREETLAKQPGLGARGRKLPPRSRQMPLPLEIVSKSRFDKTQATIYNGEDLDIPTYIRRGLTLN